MPARSIALSLALAAACASAPVNRSPPPRSGASGASVFLALDGAPARCRLDAERLPAATLAHAVATAAREQGRVGDIRAVAVEVDEGRPALVVELLAPVGPSPGAAPSAEPFCAWALRAAALLDGIAARRAQDGAGVPWPAVDAGRVHFRSVQRVSNDGVVVGFAAYSIGARPDGARVLVSQTAVLARTGGTWHPSDAVHAEDADARGMLERGRYVRVSEGLQYRIELRRTGERAFGYAGVARGRALDGTFEAPAGLATTLVRVDLFRASAGGGPAEPVHLDAYDPQRDPTAPTPVVHRRDPARPHGIVTQFGPRPPAAGVLDRDGIYEWLEVPGERPTRYETIWRDGVP